MALGVGILLTCGLTQVAAAQSNDPVNTYYEDLKRRSVKQEKDQIKEAELKQQWQKLYRERLRATEEARSELEEATFGRVRAHDGAYAGVLRSEWTRRWEEAKAGLSEAERALSALPEEARHAGVPPGWLREVDYEREPK